MAIRVSLSHVTEYKYARPIRMGAQILRLRPAPHNRTPVHRYSLRLSPSEHFLNWQQDPHGNYLARVIVPELTPSFKVEVGLVLELEAYSPFDFFLEPSCEEYPFAYDPELKRELLPYLEQLPSEPIFDEYVERVDRRKRRTVDFLVDLNQRLRGDIEYLIRMEPGVQTPAQTLQLKRGSCRDSAWLMVQMLRRLGVAARFVSGYLVQLRPDRVPEEGPKGPSEDFTDLHAWCECYVPGAGWIGLDPTSGLFAAEGHIPLAATPFPSAAAPITGATEVVETEFGFAMSVERIIDRPRIANPYSEEQWQDILQRGDQVDERLVTGDVRLTVGGEPTFVSEEHPDAPEWNTQALGGRKEELADRLMRRLFPLWGPGGALHHGQGKWYPGEPLPRWAHSCFYRVDGVPLWKDRSLFARSGISLGHDEHDAERFIKRLIVNLGLEGKHALYPAYEDAWYYMWRERKLPSNVDVYESRLEDKSERDRISRIFEQGLTKVVGFTLPLGYYFGWLSGSWFLRQERMMLIPGDSPMGFRLPLDSISWALPHDRDAPESPDPFSPPMPLPSSFRLPPVAPGQFGAPLMRQFAWDSHGEDKPKDADQALSPLDRVLRREPEQFDRDEAAKRRMKAAENTPADPFVRPLAHESALGIVRTALCVEPRGGILRVFLPPVPTGYAYAELLAAIEQTCSELSMPVQLEGYPPPLDPQIHEFKVTPDPGVIEVNVPPTAGWRPAVSQMEELYEAARQEHLVAEKFDIDGTHVGSGGGNHLVMGGGTAADSPFLRRPDVLASLLRFWHNHPSLSFLFAGRFIGPTSQAPRVDEARNDSTYELEIALGELQRGGSNPAPWFVDRVLRHLLTDVTGNTHRAEFCIDKLFSPDSATGRLGLVEMRAFEMPPHERMSAVQQLLVRTLLAVFWERQYEAELVKWGTRLHDEFMLPFYVWNDVEQVLSELQAWGQPMHKEWFLPHYEFRFPRYGEVSLNDALLEVRGGLEPWLVLGEEATAGGQARYVDSSVERLQVSTKGWVGERYQLLCNRHVVPLQATAENGGFVAGIRYRAWQPPSCLHPTIPVHAPLRFDIYDTWSEKSVAGCTYYVAHPGGRSAEDRPVNAVAAESRRLARFSASGHTPGTFEPVRGAVHPHFPRTLDLRRSAPEV